MHDRKELLHTLLERIQLKIDRAEKEIMSQPSEVYLEKTRLNYYKMGLLDALRIIKELDI